jgi:regulator of replication initiation timing
MKHALPIPVILAVLAIPACLAWGCNGRTQELEKQNAVLQQQNKELAQGQTAQDEYIDDVVTAVNEVYQNIETARATEKNLITESKGIEGAKTQTKEDVRKDLIDRIAALNGNIQDNYKKVNDLEKKVNTSRKQYASLQTMVENLRKTLEEREASITALEMRVKGLEGEVAQKAEQVRQRDLVIDAQKKEMATVYYVIGTRRELEEKGIIKDEGGFLWGLIGSTTTLAPNFDLSYFTPIDKGRQTTFRVDKRIREILPKRAPEYYPTLQPTSDGGYPVWLTRKPTWQDRASAITTN